MSDVKILVVYHKDTPRPDGKDFFPIQAGRALSSPLPFATGDDTGDNISEKNPTYNELTAVYWAWKNLDADYYGLCHYRRFFRFRPGKKIYYSRPHIDERFFDTIAYDPDSLRDLLASCDFIAPMPMKRKSVYDHYASAHDATDLDAAGEIIRQNYPDYSDAFHTYVYGTDSYFYNMFIFDKETFFSYCEFLFGVLRELEPRFTNKRMFVSERLTGVFITRLIAEGKQGLFLPTVCADEKPRFAAAVRQVKQNLAARTQKGLRSLLYAYKPLLLWLLPAFVFRAYRNRK